MTTWHHRKQLIEVVRLRLGHSEETAQVYFDMEDTIARLWTSGEHDMSYYNHPVYAYEGVNCFNLFTKGYVRYFAKWCHEQAPWHGKRLNEVLDYGCGIAASSRLFNELAHIGVIAHYYGDPQHDSLHCDAPYQVRAGFAICQSVDTSNLVHVLATDPEQIRKALSWDGIMAFEVLEHELEPLKLFDQLVKDPNTWVFCESSSFSTADKYGHWPTYIVDGEKVDRMAMSRRWKKELAKRGWTLTAKGWNGRPAIWTRL